MTPASIAGTWTGREIDRFSKRVVMFASRRLTNVAAEKLAERLVERDRDGDDRRICLECRHLRRSGVCQVAHEGRMHGASVTYAPVTTVLQRCWHFDWEVPK
jgi:hypothetical protein